MIRRILDSMAVRVGLIFLAGLLALQSAIVAVVLWPDGRPAVFRLVSPEDAVAMARALERTPVDQRAPLVAALNTGGQIVELAANFPDEGLEAGVRRPSRWVERSFDRYDLALGDRPFAVQTRPSRAMSALLRGEVGAPGSIRLLVGLDTGEVMVIERAPIVLQRLFARLFAIAGAMTVILAAVMVLCMVQMARPIDRLARDARNFAGDVDAPDLATRGAREIKDLTRALNQMKRQIRGLIEERTRILAAIAHDLRTYLTRLRLRAEFIDVPDQRRRAVADLEEMSLLLDDTLTFADEARAGAEAGRETLDLGREVAALVASRREAGEPVEAALPLSEAVLAVCRPLAFRRMIANLVDNALRYGGGAHIGLTRSGTEALVVVEDDGPGAPDSALAELLEPFRRLEPSRGRQTGGAGLGLAIVKALADSQGGRLTLENRPEGGLRATIALPMASAPLAAVTV